MLPQEIIRKKRDKQNLSAEEIDFFVRGVTDGTIADCQIGSFTMAAFLNGLDAGETKKPDPCHARFRRRFAMAGTGRAGR